MDLLTLLAIALGLAMDAFAVAIASSIILERAFGRITRRQVFRLAFHFGLFQALMPALGWIAGLSIEHWIRDWDHWVAFGLLVFVGGRAVKGAFEQDGEVAERRDPTKGASLVVLSVATSIDALAVGFSFAALRIRLLLPVVVIGLMAALMTILGMFLGSRLGARFGQRMEIAGGLVLIAIGVRIVIEHIWLG